MKQRIKKNDGIPPIIGVILMVLMTVILMGVIAFCVFGLGPIQNQYYKIRTEDIDKDLLMVRIIDYSDNSPLQNVTIRVLEHVEGRLLSGPYLTNESGYTLIQIPQGYDEYFDIVGEYENITNTKTIDKRPLLVKSGDLLGSLGIELIIVYVGLVAGAIGWYLREGKKQTRKMKKKRKSEDNTNPKHQPNTNGHCCI